ncbi:MAG: hypothetical protein KIT24_07925 [Phycisphaeraceae bacterium]|nr:hypothetical protein [Phycisphaeraceae bacterium]
MSTFPIGIARVPNLLLSRLMLGGIMRGQIDLARLQEQLATSRQVNRPSDDAVKAASIALLNDRADRSGQLIRNLQHADAALTAADQALADAGELLLEAKTIASSQVNSTAGPTERVAQANVVETLIRSLYAVATRSSVAGYIFSGANPASSPVEAFQGGYRTLARGEGLRTDIGAHLDVPITLPGTALGSTSARMVGLVAHEPDLAPDVPLHELRGARGLGVRPGVMTLTVDADEPRTIDLSGVSTIRGVIDAVTSALRAYEAETGRSILGPGGVGVSGRGLTFDLLSAAPDPDPVLAFGDIGAGTLAQDLGLARADGTLAYSAGGVVTGDSVAPNLSWLTALADIPGLSLPLGPIRLQNNGRSAIVDLANAETIHDIRRAIEGAGLGVRVDIDADRLVVVNEVANGRAQAMSITEVSGNGGTASALGIRTFDLGTRIADFNDGRGVQIITGSTDPVTGLPAPERDIDFTLRLGSGVELHINLASENVTTVGSLLQAINNQAAAQLAALSLPSDLIRAELGEDANGIRLIQDSALGGRIEVIARNGSPAAEQLGLLDAHWHPDRATLAAPDRATVRVDNIFTRLIDLRDALLADDTAGITLAGEGLDRAIDQTAQTRGLVGGYARRIDDQIRHIEDRTVLDEIVRSQLQDLDFAAAASRFTLLQTQLEAGYRSAASIGRMTLLDFLGV